jgi:imidazolonepropionase-like amidohydrolase
LPPLIQQYWKSGGAGVRSDEEKFQRQLDLVASMHRAGVKLLAGTDTPNPFVFPGDSLHEELELLVKAGLTPVQALQCATLRPAEYLGMMDRLGSIAAGKLADLVLLDADPLASIANTRRIAAVILNGKLQSSKASAIRTE